METPRERHARVVREGARGAIGASPEKGAPVPPTVGRIVLYRLTSYDVARIIQQRTTKLGIIHDSVDGPTPSAGDELPMIVTAWWEHPVEGRFVSGQVFLDGNDTLWMQSVSEGKGEGHWRWPPRV